MSLVGSPLLPRRALLHHPQGSMKGATVLIDFHLEGDIDTIGDALRGNTSHLPKLISESDSRLKYDDVVGCSYWQEVGRIDRIPSILEGLTVIRVVLRHRITPGLSSTYAMDPTRAKAQPDMSNTQCRNRRTPHSGMCSSPLSRVRHSKQRLRCSMPSVPSRWNR